MTKEDYMSLSKKRLAELLAERDVRDALALGIGNPITIKSYEPDCWHGGQCINPFHDCINCPHKDTTGGYGWVDTTGVEYKQYGMGAATDIKREE